MKKGEFMTAAADQLLVKFRSQNTAVGVTRHTVKALAKALDLNETQVIHMALSRFASDVLPGYEPDDGPLSSKQMKALQKDATKHLPSGSLLSSQTLFA
jgi:hypothetical protein